MKKYLFLFAALCMMQLMPLNLSASHPVYTGCLDVSAYSTITDGNGNVYVTGAFCSPTVTFGTITLINAAPPNSDMFIVKYDVYGTALWAVHAGGNSSDGGSSIATDGAGNIYVTGTFGNPSITFFGTTLETITITNAESGMNDMFIVKYNASGQVLWAQNGGGNTNGICVSVDGSGNAYVTGAFYGPFVTFGTVTLTNEGTSESDMFIVKYDTYGSVQWAESAGGSDGDYGNSIATDSSGHVYVTGRFTSSVITFGSTTLTNANPGSRDIFIVKYDAINGDVIWAKREGGSSEDHDGGVTTDASGNVYMTGGFMSPSITFGTITLINAAPFYNDMFIVKYNSAGTVQWAKRAGGDGQDNGEGIAAHDSDFVYVTGGFSSTTITFGNITLTSPKKSGINIFTVKYDDTGNVLWAKSAGGTGTDIAWSVATDLSGNAYVVGYFSSSTITFGTITLTNNTKWNAMFITKYNANGNVPWAKCVVGGLPLLKNEGINDAPDSEMTIYPNPTSGKVILSTANSQPDINSISVINLAGKEVLNLHFPAGSGMVEIDLSSQPKGLYILLINVGENFYSRKIILE